MAKVVNPDNDPNNEPLSTGLTIVSFCLPIVGAIIYLVKKKESPKQAQTACYAALWGLGVNLILNIIGQAAG